MVVEIGSGRQTPAPTLLVDLDFRNIPHLLWLLLMLMLLPQPPVRLLSSISTDDPSDELILLFLSPGVVPVIPCTRHNMVGKILLAVVKRVVRAIFPFPLAFGSTGQLAVSQVTRVESPLHRIMIMFAVQYIDTPLRNCSRVQHKLKQHLDHVQPVVP